MVQDTSTNVGFDISYYTNIKSDKSPLEIQVDRHIGQCLPDTEVV